VYPDAFVVVPSSSALAGRRASASRSASTSPRAAAPHAERSNAISSRVCVAHVARAQHAHAVARAIASRDAATTDRPTDRPTDRGLAMHVFGGAHMAYASPRIRV
jgi:hypothetical protein